jgi:hypothetical protein
VKIGLLLLEDHITTGNFPVRSSVQQEPPGAMGVQPYKHVGLGDRAQLPSGSPTLILVQEHMPGTAPDVETPDGWLGLIPALIRGTSLEQAMREEIYQSGGMRYGIGRVR